MFELKTIMERNVSYVHPETHIYVAMNLLVKENLTGLPVVDADMKLVGIITEKDLLRLLVSNETTDKKTVADYMTRHVVSYKETDSAVDVCEYLMHNPIRMVPVTSNDQFVGVVRRRDIIYLILKVRGKIYKKHK